MELRKIAEAVTPADIAALIRDKYDGDRDADISEDLLRLASGEPLAYIIGWIPFLGLKIFLETSPSAAAISPQLYEASTARIRPLIPRPETEWWTEKLIEHLKYKFEDKTFKLLDLCAGSGAIGLAVLNAFPNAEVSFGDIEPEFETLILKNIQGNNLDRNRADIRVGDLFLPFAGERFDIIATNPPYIPDDRNQTLDESVLGFEPHNALFSGKDGLDIITRISKEVSKHLNQDGELWMECDITNIGEAEKLIHEKNQVGEGASPTLETSIEIDQYGRPRLLIVRFS